MKYNAYTFTLKFLFSHSCELVTYDYALPYILSFHDIFLCPSYLTCTTLKLILAPFHKGGSNIFKMIPQSFCSQKALYLNL